MFEESIQTCPKEVWDNNPIFSFQAYHSLFFLDYYLTIQPKGFAPPDRFSYSEFDEEPQIVTFSQESLLDYLAACKEKARNLIEGLDEQLAEQRWINESKTMDYSILEILLYNLRHVQHHVGQFNLLLRQHIDNAPKWIEKSRSWNIWMLGEFFWSIGYKIVQSTKYQVQCIFPLKVDFKMDEQNYTATTTPYLVLCILYFVLR